MNRTVKFQGGNIHYPTTQTNDGPVNKLEFLRKSKNELSAYEGIMTPYEKQTISNDLHDKQQSYYSEITNYYLNKWDQAIDQVKAAQATVQKAKQNEVNRWDTVKLSDNFNLIESRINRAAKIVDHPISGRIAIDEIGAIYNEAQQSGDIYKQRAAAEIVQSIQLPGDRLKAASLINASKNVLKSLKQTDELKAAIQQMDKTVNETLLPVRAEVMDAAEVLGESIDNIYSGHNYAKALQRIEMNPATRELVILEKDDPKLRGFLEIKQQI